MDEQEKIYTFKELRNIPGLYVDVDGVVDGHWYLQVEDNPYVIDPHPQCCQVLCYNPSKKKHVFIVFGAECGLTKESKFKRIEGYLKFNITLNME